MCSVQVTPSLSFRAFAGFSYSTLRSREIRRRDAFYVTLRLWERIAGDSPGIAGLTVTERAHAVDPHATVQNEIAR